MKRVPDAFPKQAEIYLRLISRTNHSFPTSELFVRIGRRLNKFNPAESGVFQHRHESFARGTHGKGRCSRFRILVSKFCVFVDQGDYASAAKFLRRALDAPPRPGRDDADAGRRGEVQEMLAMLREKHAAALASN